MFDPNDLYRATGITLRGLKKKSELQRDLFDNYKKIVDKEALYRRLDHIANKYGIRKMHLGTSHEALEFRVKNKKDRRVDGVGVDTCRRATLYKKFSVQHLTIPYLGEVN